MMAPQRGARPLALPAPNLAFEEKNVFAAEYLVVTALIALVVGIGVGVLLGRSNGSAKQQKELEQSLARVKLELDSYQQDVAKHFMETAKKVSELSQSYRDLNQHLADGAMRLTSTEITQKLIAASEENGTKSKPVDLSPVEPPKDWAPRIPGTHGMLSEEFGLQDHEDATPPILHDVETPAKKR